MLRAKVEFANEKMTNGKSVSCFLLLPSGLDSYFFVAFSVPVWLVP